MPAYKTLGARELGGFEPLSIATAEAIESAFGFKIEGEESKPPIQEYDLLLVNVMTLYRNLMGSIPVKDHKPLRPYPVAEVLATEMRVIEERVSELTDGRCTVGFYHCTYNDIVNNFSRALIKSPTTALQKERRAFESSTWLTLRDEIVARPPIQQWDRKFDELGGRCLLLSHYPIDLLNRYRFSKLDLLESHTGAIKPPHMWNTKLKGGWDLEYLPFDRFTLQMFGDDTHFAPMPIKIRKVVYNIAVKKRWDHATTKDYVIHSIVQHRDPALEALVKDLYRN